MARQKSQQQRSSFAESGKILGLKWYWWIFIVVLVFILIMAISAIGKGSGGIAGNLSRAFLGFADGILNILQKSPIFWIFAIAVLFPFIGRGVSAIFSLYKGHFGEEKTTEDAAKDVGLDKDSLDKSIEQKRKEGKSEDQIRKELLKERGTDVAKQYNDLEFDRIQNQINEGKMTLEEGKTALRESQDKMDKAVDDFNKEHDADATSPKDKTPENLQPKK